MKDICLKHFCFIFPARLCNNSKVIYSSSICLLVFFFKPQHPSIILQIFTFSFVSPTLNVSLVSTSVISVSCFHLHLTQASKDSFRSSFHGNCESARGTFRSKEKGTSFVLRYLKYCCFRLCHQKTGVIVMVSARTGLKFCGSWEGVWPDFTVIPYHPMSLPGVEEKDSCFLGGGHSFRWRKHGRWVEWFSICLLLGVSTCFHFSVLPVVINIVAVTVHFLI